MDGKLLVLLCAAFGVLIPASAQAEFPIPIVVQKTLTRAEVNQGNGRYELKCPAGYTATAGVTGFTYIPKSANGGSRADLLGEGLHLDNSTPPRADGGGWAFQKPTTQSWSSVTIVVTL